MNLTLYVPGLFGPAARFSEEFVPAAPALEYLLGRATCLPFGADGYHAALCALFGVAMPSGRDVPVAAMTRLIDADEFSEGCWMRADPVHLRPDRRGLTLLDAPALRLEMREALALASELRDICAREDWRLEVPHADRWYVGLPRELALCTRELDAVVARDVGQALPTGADAARMHGLLNEMQMCLHRSEVNRAREANGLPTANSLWPWGIGELPPAPTPRWWKVFADEVSARAFARLSGVPSAPIPPGPDALPVAGGDEALLVVHDACKRPAQMQDLQSWHDALVELERNWFRPCVDRARRGDMCLWLIAGGSRYRLSRAARYRFWRRPASLAGRTAAVRH